MQFTVQALLACLVERLGLTLAAPFGLNSALPGQYSSNTSLVTPNLENPLRTFAALRVLCGEKPLKTIDRKKRRNAKITQRVERRTRLEMDPF